MATTTVVPGQSSTSGGSNFFRESSGAAETKPETGQPDASETSEEEVEEIEGEEDAAAGGQPEGDEQEQKTEGADIDKLIEQFAKEHHLDLNDANQRLIAKRLADKEAHILELKGQKEKPEPAKDYLADFAKSLEPAAAKEEKPSAAAAPGPATEGRTAEPDVELPEFIKTSNTWKSRTQPYEALNEAYGSGDLNKVADTEDALFFTRLRHIALPLMHRMMDNRIQQLLDKDLAEVIPAAKASVNERRQESAREHAISALSKIPEFKDVVPKLFQVEEGDPIEYQGQSFDNSPINRLFVEFPGLLRIREDDADPDKAEKKTFFSRYMEAAKIYKRLQKQAPSGKEVKKLMDAGAQMNEREREQGRVRQGLNSGSGSTSRGKGAPQNWVERVLNSDGGEKSARSLF